MGGLHWTQLLGIFLAAMLAVPIRQRYQIWKQSHLVSEVWHNGKLRPVYDNTVKWVERIMWSWAAFVIIAGLAMGLMFRFAPQLP